ncbi:hypothetical protein HDE_08737 [Halotydeus destructor]|nr:hypothetical protein HDE_08737 [Halotydeus destructor]
MNLFVPSLLALVALVTAAPDMSNLNKNTGYLYYVPDKTKDGYQAAASSQYASSVPVSASQGSGSAAGYSESDPSSNAGAAAASGSDLNYSAQDLTYSAQTLGQGLADAYASANGQNAGSNYDQTLSNLASQLQQYGYAAQQGAGNGYGQGQGAQASYGQTGNTGYTQTGNSGYAAQGQQQGQGQQQPAYGYYEQAGQASGSEQNTAYSPVSGNQLPNYQANNAGANGYNIPQGQQNQQGQFAGYNPAQFGQQYPGAQHFGNYPAASGQHGAFEPAVSGYRRYGLGSLLMPVLALAGLSLLIPTVTSLTASSRKKRSVDPKQSAKESVYGKYFDRLERYYSLYKTAVEREDCMNRIICELGDTMTGVRGKSAIFTVLEKVVPTWMGNHVGVLKSSVLSGDQFGKCKRYTCDRK